MLNKFFSLTELLNDSFLLVSDAGQSQVYQLPITTNVTSYSVQPLRKYFVRL